MLAPSYYEATARREAPAAPLAADAHADAVVIGAGYTGLMAALELAERGLDVIVLEAERVAGGASGRNGGQLGSGQRRDQSWLEARYGENVAHALWGVAEDAKTLAKSRIVRHGIACDFKPGILHVAHSARMFDALAADAEDLAARYRYEALTVLTKADLSAHLGTDIYHGGVLDIGAGHLHPLNYALGLARAAREAGARFHENTRADAVDFEAGTVKAGGHTVTARHVVVACNGYLGGLVAQIAPVIMPINNYIAATPPLGATARELIRDDVAVSDTRFVINYFRLSVDGRLLFGGGESYSARLPDNLEDIVRPRLAAVFPQLARIRFEHVWGGTLAITFTRMPHFGRIGARGWFAHGYCGHGVAMAGMAGKLIADAICGEGERFALMAGLDVPPFPGGTVLRHPLRVAAMLYGKLRDAIA